MHPILIIILFLTTLINTYEHEVRRKIKRPANLNDFAGDFLIGLSTTCNGFDRRALIREAQIETYKAGNFSVTWRFTVLNPNNDTLRELIMQENKTHGDIIMLEKFTDSWANANWKKSYEWFTYVEQNFPKYRYVAKMDDDTYMNITGLYEHLFTERVKNDRNTIIAAIHKWNGENIPFPHGGFYAMTWELMKRLNHLYATEPMTTVNQLEDFQVAIFFKNASIPWKKLNINPRGCNYRNNDRPTPMAKCNLTYQHMNEFADIIRVHLLKEEAVYRNISSYFIKHERELRANKQEGQCVDTPAKLQYWENYVGAVPSEKANKVIYGKQILDEL